MKQINENLKDLTSFYYKFQKVNPSDRTWDFWSEICQSFDEDLERVMNLSLTEKNYRQLLRILDLFFQENPLIDKHQIEYNLNSKKQVEVQNLRKEIIDKKKELIKELEELKKNKQYNDVNDWLDSKNVFGLINSKSRRRQREYLRFENYQSEYKLYIDMRNILLSRQSTLYNRAYMYYVAKMLNQDLLQILDRRILERNVEVQELLQMFKLILKSDYFSPVLISQEWYYENIIKELNREANVRVLEQIKWS